MAATAHSKGCEGPVQGLREGLPPLRILFHLPGEDVPRAKSHRPGPRAVVITTVSFLPSS